MFVGYDEKCNPTVLNEFATAAFRFGHSLLKPTFKRMDGKFSEKGPGKHSAIDLLSAYAQYEINALQSSSWPTCSSTQTSFTSAE